MSCDFFNLFFGMIRIQNPTFKSLDGTGDVNAPTYFESELCPYVKVNNYMFGDGAATATEKPDRSHARH